MKNIITTKRMVAAVVALALTGMVASPASATTGAWTGGKLTPADPTGGRLTATTYQIDETAGVTASAVFCIKLTVADNPSYTGSLPPGFSFDSGSSSSVGGVGQFVTGTWANGGVVSKSITFTNAGGVTPTAGNPLTLTNVKNPTASGSYYMRVETFGNQNCVASPLDSTDIGFVISDNTTVYTHVDPTLVFTVAGRNAACNGQLGTVVDNTGPAGATAVQLGNISALTVGAGSQDLAVTTNATGGAAVFVRGLNATQNLRNAAHNFLDSGTSAPVAGTERFGYTAANASPGLASNTFRTLTATNAQVASSVSGDVAATCIGFQASAASNTPAGDYTATVIYTAVPTY